SLLESVLFLFSSRRRHTRSKRDWSSDVCSSDLTAHNRVTVYGTFSDYTLKTLSGSRRKKSKGEVRLYFFAEGGMERNVTHPIHSSGTQVYPETRYTSNHGKVLYPCPQDARFARYK